MDSAQVLAAKTRTAQQIAHDIRGEFDEAFRELQGSPPRQQDPVLAALFHAFATQISRLYEEANQEFPIGVLDDLIDGLALPPRLAVPAQTVVAFTEIEERESISPETLLSGYSATGERIVFAPDTSIELTPAHLLFAAVYDDGKLHAVAGASLPDDGPAIPATATAPLQLGKSPPTLFLALDLDETHLSGLGVFIDVPPRGPVALALRRSAWQVLGHDGRATDAALLRSRPSRGGISRLEWLSDPSAVLEDPSVAQVLPLPDGFYGPQIWIFPYVPPERRFRCVIPPAIARAVSTLLPPGYETALDQPLTWLQIPLPVGTTGATHAIRRIEMNCVTASNVEILSQQLRLDRTGQSVNLQPEGRSDRHLMGVLSVTGEGGGRYTEESSVESGIDSGRYRYRNGRLELRPGRSATGRYDTSAMIRLLYCDAGRANGLDVGAVRQIGEPLARNVTAAVTNLTVTRGGMAPPGYADARVRFADLLRTRERIVTAGDVDIAVRAFEPRALSVQIESIPEFTEHGFKRAEQVTVRVRRSDFADPDADLLHLRTALQDHLQSRAVLGSRILVEIDAGV